MINSVFTLWVKIGSNILWCRIYNIEQCIEISPPPRLLLFSYINSQLKTLFTLSLHHDHPHGTLYPPPFLLFPPIQLFPNEAMRCQHGPLMFISNIPLYCLLVQNVTPYVIIYTPWVNHRSCRKESWGGRVGMVLIYVIDNVF